MDELSKRRAERDERAAEVQAEFDAAAQLIEDSGDDEVVQALAETEARVARVRSEAAAAAAQLIEGSGDDEVVQALAETEARVARVRSEAAAAMVRGARRGDVGLLEALDGIEAALAAARLPRPVGDSSERPASPPTE